MERIVKDLDELTTEILKPVAYLSFTGEIALIVKPESPTECFTLMDYAGKIKIFDVGSGEYMVLSPKPSSEGVAFSLKLQINGQWEKTKRCDNNGNLYLKAQCRNMQYNG